MPISTSISETVAQVRKHFAAVRTMQRNTRLGHYQGRNNGGDHSFREAKAWELVDTLPRELQGLLTSEHKLALRISENNDQGVPRPELRVRLAYTRLQITELVG